VLATAPQAAVESSATAAAVDTAPTTTPPSSSPVAAAAPVAIVAARFDADYLDNPAPVYPLMSRRRGEHGSVMVRVQVGADGAAQHVEVSQSCGYPRLDEAALKAVRAWRFVPARRGNEAVSASVIVPIVFALDR
jgi:protein TonB